VSRMNWRMATLISAGALLLPGQEYGQPFLPALNEEVTRLSRTAGPEDAAPLHGALLRRKTALLEALRQNPADLQRWLLPASTRDRLARSAFAAEGLVESSGEWSGQLEVRIEDDWENARSIRRFVLWEGGTPLEFIPLNGGELPARCGERVSIRGIRMAGEWVAGEITSHEPLAAGLPCSLTGEQKVAVILINFPSTPLSATVTAASMQAAFFGAGRSLDTYWREVSGGAAWATGAVFGPFDFTTNYTCNQSDAIRTAAIQAADSSLDFRQYNRIFLIVPNAGSCSVGLGTYGCGGLSSSGDGSFTASTTWLRADYLTTNDAVLSVAAHEGGHNLGLNHASSLDYGAEALGPFGSAGTHSEYENRYSIMGISWRVGNAFNLGHYTANHKAELGWLSLGDGYQQVSTAGSYSLLPAETGSAGTRALRVERGAGSNKWLWLEYRRPLGLFDTNLASYSATAYSGALIHYEDPASSYPGYARVLDFHPSATPNNFSDAVLRAGESWADPYSLLRLFVDNATTTSAAVRVQYDTPCAVLNPLSQTLPAAAGPASVTVTAAAGCAWTAVSNAPSWLHVTAGASGSGSGVVSLSLDANTSGFLRQATVTIQRQNVTVRQEAAVAPGTPSLQSPANNATGIALSPTLTWSAASNATSYDLHLGTASPPPLFSSGIGSTSATPGPLAPATRYYWRVVSRNAYGTANSTIRSFTTMSVSYPADKPGVFRGGYFWLLDANGNRQFDGTGQGQDYAFPMGGLPGDIPVTGDWNGDGRSKAGFYRNGGWYLDLNGDRVFNGSDVIRWFGGQPGDVPVTGDWNGDGRTDIGVFRGGFYWILDANGNGAFDGTGANLDEAFAFGGVPGDKPITGDWNGDGRADVGLFRQGFFWILDGNGDRTFTGANGDAAFAFGGLNGDVPLTGDWNGDGRAEVGVFRAGYFWVLDGNGDRAFTGANGDAAFAFGGLAGDQPLAGHW